MGGPYSSDQLRSPHKHSNMRIVLPVFESSRLRTRYGISPQHSQLRVGWDLGAAGGVVGLSPSLTRPSFSSEIISVEAYTGSKCRREKWWLVKVSLQRLKALSGHGETADRASNASSKAGGMTTIPSFRNCQAATRSPSRRKAISQRIVASEPVTERFGPRSTPIRIAPVTC
jgi:hypothetical protein